MLRNTRQKLRNKKVNGTKRGLDKMLIELRKEPMKKRGGRSSVVERQLPKVAKPLIFNTIVDPN